MVYENNSHIFEAVDDDALKVAEETYLSYSSLVRDLVGKCTSDIEKARALFRYSGLILRTRLLYSMYVVNRKYI